MMKNGTKGEEEAGKKRKVRNAVGEDSEKTGIGAPSQNGSGFDGLVYDKTNLP